jgi:F-type H+-transporting ATPase subunit b
MAIISSAFAEEAATTQAQTSQAHGGGAHEGGAFPPFEMQNFAPQLVWLALIFGVLYVLMSRVALPRVGRILSDRDARIAADLDASREMQTKAQAAALANDETLRMKREEARAIGRSAQERISAESAARRDQEEKKFKSRLDEADTRIAADKARALANVEAIATDAAAAIVRKLTGGDVDPATLAAEYHAVKAT